MSDQEEEFMQRLRATFKVEAAEHVQAISSGLLTLEKTTAADARAAQIEVIFRHAHSLKGAARATNFSGIESICQSLEDVFAAWKSRNIAATPERFDVLHGAIDLIETLVGSADGKPTRELAEKISAAARRLGGMAADDAVAESSAPVRAAASAIPERPAVVPPPTVPAPPEPSPPSATAAASPVRPVTVPAVLAETIRISAAKLDQVLLEAEEMLTVKQAVTQRAGELRDLERVFGEWAKQWTRVQPHVRELRGATAPALGEFLDWNLGWIKSLESRLRALGKAATQDRYDVTRRVDDLLGDSKTLVMLPFSTLADGFPKLVRDLCRDQGKEADLVVRGGDVEMEKRILEEVKDPLVHLLRNSLDHGVEKPEVRVAKGKPRRATVTITMAPIEGNKVEITVADDGGGIDVARVRATAVKRGLVPAAEAASLNDARVLDFIFQSEVSTSPIITEISGRGLGLAIVREKTEKLGGRTVVENRAPHGAVFRVIVPLTLATFRGVLVRAAGQVLVIPTAHVERVARVAAADVKTVENRETISLDGRALSLARLEQVLELVPPNGNGAAKDSIPVAVLGYANERIAFTVDEVLYDEEVLVKSFARPLARVRNIAGATVLASGRVAPILNVADLMKSAHNLKLGAVPRAPAAVAIAGEKRPKSVLLAEDSITSRMLLKGILESAGYRVTTAVDGVEAFTLLRMEEFDAVVSDIEMPRMNGFDLTAQIRGDKKLAEKPVVLVTALASQADRERGIDVGANAYIVKSSFDQSNLLGVLRRIA